jgi:hypothetical protein
MEVENKAKPWISLNCRNDFTLLGSSFKSSFLGVVVDYRGIYEKKYYLFRIF